MSVALEQARMIITGARSEAQQHKMMPLTVAVLDSGGHMVALEREDWQRHHAGGNCVRQSLRLARHGPTQPRTA